MPYSIYAAQPATTQNNWLKLGQVETLAKALLLAEDNCDRMVEVDRQRLDDILNQHPVTIGHVLWTCIDFSTIITEEIKLVKEEE